MLKYDSEIYHLDRRENDDETIAREIERWKNSGFYHRPTPAKIKTLVKSHGWAAARARWGHIIAPRTMRHLIAS